MLLTITRRNLLQWHTLDGRGAKFSDRSGRSEYGGMSAGSRFSPCCWVVASRRYRPARQRCSACFSVSIVVACFSLLVAWLLSRPISGQAAHLQPEDVDFLEEVARTTWQCFLRRRFIGPRGQLASARQLSGVPGAGARAPNISTDEYGFGTPIESGGQ